MGCESSSLDVNMSFSFIATLSREQICSVQRDTHELWGSGESLEARQNKLSRLMNSSRLNMCGLVENGVVASSMKCYSLQLSYQERVWKTLGMGAIFTHEQFRKSGLAQQLIEEVLARARGDNFNAALLFSDIGPSYYERFGFTAYPAEKMSVEVNDIPRVNLDCHYRRALPHDVAQLLTYHDRALPSSCVRVVHDAQSWAFTRERFGDVEDYVVTHNGVDRGYFSISNKDSSIILHEFSMPKDHDAALFATIKILAELHGVTTIKGRRPFNHLEFLPMVVEKPAHALPMILTLDDNLPKDASSWFGSLDEF